MQGSSEGFSSGLRKGQFMAQLKVMPPPFGSADELLAVSHALEKEAARRYRDLAAKMSLRQEGKLQSLFEFMASIEEKHADHVAGLSLRVLGRAIAPEQISWELPENFDEEEGSSRRLSPYRALAIAVRNEERAFAFYSYAAAVAADGLVRQLAEELAKEELEHAFLLRRERRKAYREENKDGRKKTAGLPASVEEFWAVSAEAEWRASRYHRALAAHLRQANESSSIFEHAADDEEQCARDLAARLGVKLQHENLEVTPGIEGGLTLLEEAFDRYADIAERSKDEKVVHEAQKLAERAVRRLGLVHGSVNNSLLAGRKP
jgi:rubrerythrin